VTVNESTKAFVRQRANHACEYCQRHQNDSPLATLHVEHIIPKKHDGSDDEDNLALACIDCNLHKGPNLTGLDPDTDQITPLFHPRQQVWDEHFYWDGIYIRGLTDTGRTTVRVFNMNSDDQLALRSS
jgi:5-methylcytosine-specific restriction endonuclease McrA